MSYGAGLAGLCIVVGLAAAVVCSNQFEGKDWRGRDNGNSVKTHRMQGPVER